MFLFKKQCIKCKYITFSLRAISTGDLFIKLTKAVNTFCEILYAHFPPFCGLLCSFFQFLQALLLSLLTVYQFILVRRACMSRLSAIYFSMTVAS